MQDRLQQFLQLEQLTPARLSDIIGVQRSGLSHILSGRNKPGFDFILRLLIKFPTLSADWLITGKGKMYKEVKDAREEGSFRESKIINEISEAPKTDDSPDIEQNDLDFIVSQPSENPIKVPISNYVQKNRLLKKVLLVYSDNTFEEINPGKIV
ncbi:MAG: transcriptional regulator [Bacteroidetes bacterium]|nr:transcriptional regulator [Bacteroidota bacterium]